MGKKKCIQKILSYVLVLTLIIPLALGGSTKEVQATSSAAKAKSAYSSFLKTIISWSDSSSMQSGDISFGLIDINNDKIPELYLRADRWDYDYDYKLYGYIGGKVRCIYSFLKDSRLQKVYPSQDAFYVYGSYNKGRTERAYYQFNGKELIPKVAKMSSMRGGEFCYVPKTTGNAPRISKSKYNSEVRRLTSGPSKSAPKLYKNTSSNRVKYLGNTKTKMYFEKGTWYAFTNGGFNLKISKISGNKFTYSIYMPYMACNNKTATVSSSGKTAKSTFKCPNGKVHNLSFKIVNNGVSVTENSSCNKMLLAGTLSEQSKTTIKRIFELESFSG